MTLSAFEAVQPYCPCGMALERPDGWATPRSDGTEVKCGCGLVVAAKFWRLQDVLVVTKAAWR